MKSPFWRRYVSGWGEPGGATRQGGQQDNQESDGKEDLLGAEQVGGTEPLAVELATTGLGRCGLPLVGFDTGGWNGQHLTTKGHVELSQPGQRLGRTVEHQNTDQQQ